MKTKLISTAAVLAAIAIAPSSAFAASPTRAQPPTAEPNSIIAILIGFTPPIGTNHGS